MMSLDPETIAAGATAIVAALGLGGTAVKWWGGRQARADAREDRALAAEAEAVDGAVEVKLAVLEKGERTEAKLWSRLEKVEAETKECHDQRERDRIAHENQRRRDHEECDKKIDLLEHKVRRVAARAYEQRRSLAGLDELDDDEVTDRDTGLHELIDIAHGRSTPPGGLHRPLLPPPRPRETTTGTAPGEDR